MEHYFSWIWIQLDSTFECKNRIWKLVKSWVLVNSSESGNWYVYLVKQISPNMLPTIYISMASYWVWHKYTLARIYVPMAICLHTFINKRLLCRQKQGKGNKIYKLQFLAFLERLNMKFNAQNMLLKDNSLLFSYPLFGSRNFSSNSSLIFRSSSPFNSKLNFIITYIDLWIFYSLF